MTTIATPEPVACSQASRETLELAARVAASDCTVLIAGESGTGKEVLARHIHRLSPRAAQPFIAINCAAIPETLLEAVLFGHEKGAFTGAQAAHPGKFEQAQGGTLLLDEISEMPLGLQAKLLRVLQEREVERIGGRATLALDVRVLATTNRRLRAEVTAARFREDLYYRLRVIELAIPPLRARADDILPLARAILARTSRRLDRKLVGFSPKAAERLLGHRWPGNVRELENVIERAVVLCDSPTVDVEQLPPELLGQPAPAVATPGATVPLDEVERRYILAVLDGNAGNRTKTAAELGIGQATLYRKLKEYGVTDGRVDSRS